MKRRISGEKKRVSMTTNFKVACGERKKGMRKYTIMCALGQE